MFSRHNKTLGNKLPGKWLETLLGFGGFSVEPLSRRFSPGFFFGHQVNFSANDRMKVSPSQHMRNTSLSTEELLAETKQGCPFY